MGDKERKEEKQPFLSAINEDNSDRDDDNQIDIPTPPTSSSLDRQRLKYYYSLQKTHGIKFDFRRVSCLQSSFFEE